MMSRFFAILAPLGLGGSKEKTREDDDLTDKLNHSYTVMLIVIFAVVVSTKQYVGDPIHCWVPGHFTNNHDDYAQHICWVSNFYYLPIEERIPLEGEPRRWINYYQWLPIVLLAQACLFYIPCLVWSGISGKVGVEIRSVVEAGKHIYDIGNRDKTLKYMVRTVDRYLGHYRDQPGGRCFRCTSRLFQRCNCHLMCGMKYGNFVTVSYLVVKFMYLLNAFGQLFILDEFLGTDFHFYGIRALESLVKDEEFPGTSRFPRVTLCDYKVRQIGHNIHRNTVQCVLPINFFNEKLFVVMWFWLLFICIATAVNFVTWLGRVILSRERVRWVKRHLRNVGRIERGDKKSGERFVRSYLRQDGVLILRLLAANTSDMVTSELIGELYDLYSRKQEGCSLKDLSEDEKREDSKV